MTTEKSAKKVQKKHEDPNIVTFSNGVKVRAKAMPPGVYMRLFAMLPPPKIPQQRIYLKAAGTYEVIANPDEPGYIAAYADWEMRKNVLLMDGVIAYGSEHVSTPKDVHSFKSKKWLEKLEMMGVVIQEDNDSWLYNNWMTNVAMTCDADYTALQKKVMRLSGVSEDDVQLAEEFPGS